MLADEVGGKAVLIDPTGKHVIELNAMGSLVWSSLDGTRDLPALVQVVLDAVDDPVDPAVVSRDVEAFLSELARLDLLRSE